MNTITKVLAVALCLVTVTAVATTAAAQSKQQQLTVTVQSVDQSKATLTYRNEAGESTADASAVKSDLANIAPRDVVDITVTADTPPKITALSVATRTTTRWDRAKVFLFWVGVLIGLAALVMGGRPQEFIVGADRRYSNSKTQLALWFLTVMSAYLTFVTLRVIVGHWDFLGNVEIPANLLAVSGLSALSFAGAKAITTQKVNAVVSKGLASPKAVDPLGPDITTDLFQNDNNEADIGDFQMIVVTLVAIGVFLFAVFNALAVIPLKHVFTMPDIDSTLLSAFGLGQGAYLVKKLASNPGDG